MIIKVAMLVGEDSRVITKELQNVTNITNEEGFTGFHNGSNLVASFSNEGLLYYEVISLG